MKLYGCSTHALSKVRSYEFICAADHFNIKTETSEWCLLKAKPFSSDSEA